VKTVSTACISLFCETLDASYEFMSRHQNLMLNFNRHATQLWHAQGNSTVEVKGKEGAYFWIRFMFWPDQPKIQIVRLQLFVCPIYDY
jgi:hypothetical protein